MPVSLSDGWQSYICCVVSCWVSGLVVAQPAQPGPGCKLLLTAMNDFIFMNGGAAGGSNTPPVTVSQKMVKFSSSLELGQAL